MTKQYTDDEVESIITSFILATLTGVACPAGALGRIGIQADRFHEFRASFQNDGVPVPCAASEERVLRAHVAALRTLQDVASQIDISLTQAPPTLGVLMERDVIRAALGVGSESCTTAAVGFAQLYAAENPDEAAQRSDSSSPFAGLLEALSGGGAPDPGRAKVKEILGDLKAYSEEAAKAVVEPLRNNPWYVPVIASLAATLRVEIDLPSAAALPERVAGWRP